MKRTLLAMILILVSGCAVTRPEPKIDSATLDRDSFLSWLADQPLVSTAEAYRAMLIAATDKDPGADFAANQREAFQRQIARPEWKLQSSQAIDKATAAFMAAQIAKIPGGINLNLLGRALHVGDRRYAYREIVWEGMPWGESPPYQVITGGEFISLMTWMDEYRTKGQEPELPREQMTR